MEMRTAAQLAETPKEAFGNYIRELEDSYLGWYARASSCNKILFVVLQGTAILAGAGTAVVAGVARDLDGLRVVLVLLPLVAAFATALLQQTRVRQVLELRERGREQVQRLISDAKAEYAAPSRDADPHFTRLHKALVDEISRIEREQALNVLSIVSALTPEPTALDTREQKHKEEGRPFEGGEWSGGAEKSH